MLKRILKDNIKDESAIDALYKVIDSTNQPYINKKIKRLKDKRIKSILNSVHINDKEKNKLINEVLEVPFYKLEKGCTIGSQTSQSFGLIYLYELSHYIKEVLKIKYLIIYMDDILIIHQDKKYLLIVLEKIKKN